MTVKNALTGWTRFRDKSPEDERDILVVDEYGRLYGGYRIFTEATREHNDVLISLAPFGLYKDGPDCNLYDDIYLDESDWLGDAKWTDAREATVLFAPQAQVQQLTQSLASVHGSVLDMLDREDDLGEERTMLDLEAAIQTLADHGLVDASAIRQFGEFSANAKTGMWLPLRDADWESLPEYGYVERNGFLYAAWFTLGYGEPHAFLYADMQQAVEDDQDPPACQEVVKEEELDDCLYWSGPTTPPDMLSAEEGTA